MLSATMNRLAERRDAAAEAGEDAGFTLIELMVVLLILAILLAIAIPTFLGVTKSADDRAAQSNLNTAFTNAQSIYQQDQQAYTDNTDMVSALSGQEPSLGFTTAAANNTNGKSSISVAVDTNSDAIAMAALAKNSNCWYVVNLTKSSATGFTFDTTGTVPNAAGEWYGVQKNAATCSAASLTGITWQTGSFPPSP